MKIKILLFAISFLVIMSGCENKKPDNEINASGTIEATDITISSKTAGQIKAILVDEGNRVKKDDILLYLDHDLLDIQLRQAQASVEQAEAQLRLLQAGARKEDIKLAEEQVQFAQINLDQQTPNKTGLKNYMKQVQ